MMAIDTVRHYKAERERTTGNRYRIWALDFEGVTFYVCAMDCRLNRRTYRECGYRVHA